ncbi:hypothetical protein FCM35_KLT01345 [Carex littledalei]|uniref:Uncharacterized protein n=1 Tax=Carex littledalei TaxID=544730 RepID=A0A833R1P8_9POAL|nr:hypothetical protein FCM35_KLT01345 [Carex littledalei]
MASQGGVATWQLASTPSDEVTISGHGRVWSNHDGVDAYREDPAVFELRYVNQSALPLWSGGGIARKRSRLVRSFVSLSSGRREEETNIRVWI